MFEKLDQLIELHAATMKKLKEEGAEALKEVLREFFAKFPEARAIRWRQYTPYFNDGDPCSFSVHEPFIQLADSKTDAGDYEDGFESEWNLSKRMDGSELAEAFKTFSRTIQSDAVESVMAGVFGDGVVVTATADKIDIDSYDHD